MEPLARRTVLTSLAPAIAGLPLAAVLADPRPPRAAAHGLASVAPPTPAHPTGPPPWLGAKTGHPPGRSCAPGNDGPWGMTGILVIVGKQRLVNQPV